MRRRGSMMMWSGLLLRRRWSWDAGTPFFRCARWPGRAWRRLRLLLASAGRVPVPRRGRRRFQVRTGPSSSLPPRHIAGRSSGVAGRWLLVPARCPGAGAAAARVRRQRPCAHGGGRRQPRANRPGRGVPADRAPVARARPRASMWAMTSAEAPARPATLHQSSAPHRVRAHPYPATRNPGDPPLALYWRSRGHRDQNECRDRQRLPVTHRPIGL
jgi:hypothetical protein